jgi:predicted lactoylglutathione lyase
MNPKSSRKLFVNLPVRDLKRAMEFFTKLGFEFKPQFTDDKAACMVISEDAFTMLLAEPYFKTFTKREVSSATKQTEAIFALSCGEKSEVDDIVKKAIAAGGKHAMDPIDHGFMYGWSFYDPDDHHWEVVWMDPNHLQK